MKMTKVNKTRQDIFKNHYGFRAVLLDDLITFLKAIDGSLINRPNHNIVVDPLNNECITTFKSVISMAQLIETLDSIEDGDEYKRIRETLKEIKE